MTRRMSTLAALALWLALCLVAIVILAHAADNHSATTELLCVISKIRGSAARAFLVGEHIPEHFSKANHNRSGRFGGCQGVRHRSIRS